MLKKIGFIIAAFFLLNVGNANAQSFDLSQLDNAISLLGQGKKDNAAGILGKAISGITSEAKASNSDFGSKILGQVGSLSKMLPALATGKADVNGIQKIVNTIKTLIAANRLKNMLGSGSLLGKGTEVGKNANILSTGLGMLGGNSEATKASKLLDVVAKKAPKLNGNGLFAKIADKVVSKKLGSSLDLIKGLI